MSTLNNTDLFLVERDGQNHQITRDQMSTLNDNDLLLVEREGVQYKVEAVDVVVDPITGEFETPVEVLTPLNGAGIGAGVPYNPISSPIVTVGPGGEVAYETSAITAESISTATHQKAAASTPTSFSAFDLSALLDGSSGSSVQLGWDAGSGTSDVLRLNFSTPVSGDVDVQFTSTNSQPIVKVYTTSNPGGSEARNSSSSNYGSQIVGFGSFTDITAIELKAAEVGGGYSGSYQQLTINSVAPSLPYSAGGQLYTFTDNTNLDKFQVGDEVGSPGGVSSVDYTGAGGTQSITGAGFSPDLVWIKCRDQAYRHALYDTVRGSTNILSSNVTGQEFSETRYGYLSSFDTDGFTVSPGSNDNDITHRSGANYVAWCWDAGDGSPVTNNDGTIQSTVKASDATGFSIVAWTGDGNAGASVGHGLGEQPAFVIIKSRTGTANWFIWSSVNTDGYLEFTTAAVTPNTGILPVTASTIGFKANYTLYNSLNTEYVGYIWAETPGVSKFGSYSGNGGSNSINTGFKPAWVLIKCATDAEDWYITDSARSGGRYLFANTASEEIEYGGIAFDDNGFTLNTSTGALNASSKTYIYAAFSAEAMASITDIDELASQMTLDADVKSVGDTLSKTSTFEASLTCSDSTELANMVGPISMTDSNGDLVTPQTSEITSVEDVPAWNQSDDWNSKLTANGSNSGNKQVLTDTDTRESYSNETEFNNNSVRVSVGSNITLSSLNVAVSGTVGVLSSNWNTGSNQENYVILANGSQIGTYVSTDASARNNAVWTDFPFTGTLNTLEVNGSNRVGGAETKIVAFRIDGKILVNSGLSGDPGAGTLLAFADSTDLEYFSPGDVVQGIPGGITVSTQLCKTAADLNWDDPNNTTKPDFLLNTFGTDDGDTGYSVIYKLDQKINSQINWRFYNATPPDQSTYKFSIYYSADGIAWSQAYDKVPMVGLNDAGLPTPAAQYYRLTLYLNGALNDSLGWFAYALSTEGIDAVKVISTGYPDSNTMVVDGGEWTVVDDSQIWSSTGFSTGGFGDPYNSDKAFNGVIDDYNNGWYAAAGNFIEFTPNLTNISTIKIYASAGGSGGTLLVNGNPVSLTPGDGTQIVVYEISASSFTSLRHDRPPATDYLAINGIEVDGKLLVDAVSDSQVWSNSLTSSNGFSSGYGPTNGFNGTTSGTHTASNAGGTLTFAPNLTIPANSTIEVYSGSSSSVYMDITVNGVANNLTAGGSFVQVNYDNSTTLTSLTITRSGGVSNSADLRGIKINGLTLIDQGVRDFGDTSISLPPLDASATDVIGVDGNTLQIDGVSGTWKTGLHIKGASISSSAPSPNSVVFTSSNGGTAAVTGTDATLASRVWTLEKSSSQTGPWTVVGEYTDLDANDSQDGATPWTMTKPALEANTFYRVKVRYTSSNAASVESIYSTFKTGAA